MFDGNFLGNYRPEDSKNWPLEKSLGSEMEDR